VVLAQDGQMKKYTRNFDRKDQSVSAVIGVILMVAITVSIAATMHVFISSMTGGTTENKVLIIAMNVYARNAALNETIWLVSGVTGEAIPVGSYETSLVYSNGTIASATIDHQDVTGIGHINSGDTFKVVAPKDGYYVFMITDTASRQIIYESIITKY
jgi:flagellin-like protein